MDMAQIQNSFSWPHEHRAAVSLTFDDARPSQVDVGLPIMDRAGVKATFYVSPPRLDERPLDWRQAVARGHEMGNHTLTHPCSGNFPWSRHNALEDYTLEAMQRELDGANAVIHEKLGVTPSTFAYPCGQTFVGRGEDARSYVPLVATRFTAGRGFRNESPNDPGYCDLAQLAAVESDGLSAEGLRSWMERALASSGWIVFAGHEVGNGGHQTVLADALQWLCEYCTEPANGIWIATVHQVSAHIAAAQRANRSH